MYALLRDLPVWAVIPGLVILVWMAIDSWRARRPAWYCRRCGHGHRRESYRLGAFCERCGTPRPRGDALGPVPVVVTVRQHTVSGAKTRVEEILAAERLGDALPSGTRARAAITAAVPEGTAVTAAHSQWTPEGVAAANGLPSFPRQPPEARVPAETVHVEVEAVERTGGGMASHFGFEGLFVSLLVSLRDGRVWDARATDAD